MAVTAPVHMSAFAGATAWLNSDPLGPAELRGRVVLVNFLTLTCINWLRQQPYVRAWSQAYRHDGLVVIGVHTPEFAFEHDIGLVRDAIQERAIDYPVVVDNDYAVWSAFANRFWPALYFVDGDGVIRDQYFGEGRYERSERVIQQLLGLAQEPVSVVGRGVEAGPTSCASTSGRSTGSGRSAPKTSRWSRPVEPLRSGSRPVTHAHLVLSSRVRDAVPFRVRLDGEAPCPSAGVDVDEDGNGVFRDGRMYQLVRQHEAVRQRTLEITFLEAGVEAYAFTFG